MIGSSGRSTYLGLTTLCVGLAMGLAAPVLAQETPPAAHVPGGEANLILPDLRLVTFLGGIDGHSLLLSGLAVSAAGLVFGLIIYAQLKSLPVHETMRDVSELIYETCKTYLQTQGKFIMILWAFIATIIVVSNSPRCFRSSNNELSP